MSLPAYPTYKDSGTLWLGKIPSHWRVERLKTTASLISEKASGQTFPIALENIESWSGRYVPTESDFEGEGTAFIKGDILFGKLRPYLAKALLTHRGGEAVGDFHVLRPRGGMNGRYLQYQILTREFIDVIDGSTFGSKMPRASWEALAGMPIIVASTGEQDAIATFLDSETSKIDALISEQEKLLELLAEKRQATISHAVTRGLNPAAPMKDSGAEWLGVVPEHWQIQRLKTISPHITVGIVVEPSKYYCSTGIPALRSLNVAPGRITTENFVFISEEANSSLAKSMLFEGDLVAVRSGQTGISAVVPKELDGCNCIDLIIIRKPVEDSPEFLCWYFASDSAVHQFTEGSGGAIQQHFNIGTAMNLRIPVPPRNEQLAIVEFLESETAKLDTLKLSAEYAIELLKERRAALISAAVTGKIDVRERLSALVATA